MTSLAPCPFCGGEAIIAIDNHFSDDGSQCEDSVCRVRCLGCGAKIEGAVEKDVVWKWNTRVYDYAVDHLANRARLENIALGSLILKLEDIVRKNEMIFKTAGRADE